MYDLGYIYVVAGTVYIMLPCLGVLTGSSRVDFSRVSCVGPVDDEVERRGRLLLMVGTLPPGEAEQCAACVLKSFFDALARDRACLCVRLPRRS